MGSLMPAPESEASRQHAVMIPYPAQGHVTPMLQLAKLLHARGFHITFVNNEFNHRRHLRARGPRALDGAPGFRFATIDDGLPPSDDDATQDVPALCRSTMTTCLPRFKDLIARLDAEAESTGSPRVTCVVADSTMTFGLRAARELGLRCATLWTASACGFLGYHHYRHLVDRGLVPLKEESHLLDGHLDATVVDWVPGAPAGGPLRLRDFPSFVRTTDPEDTMLNFFIHETAGMLQASAVVINTFDELDAPQLRAMARLLGLPVLTVGPLPLTVRNNVPPDSPVAGIASNLWKEDHDAPLRWLDDRVRASGPRSVVYVNFGSITVMSAAQLAEFAWGLANTGYEFLWNVRPDLANGAGGLPPEFLAAVEGRALLTTWCPQEAVLAHEAVGVFLTLRLELHAREHLRRRTHGVLALLRRAADQLPVQVHRLGHRDGGPRRGAEGRGGGAHTGGHGGREGPRDAAACGGTQGQRLGRSESRRPVHVQRGQAHRGGAPCVVNKWTQSTMERQLTPLH